MMQIISLLIFFPKIICGFAIVHWLWNKADFASITIKVALGIPLGLALSSGLFFAAILFDIQPKIYSQVEFWGLSVIATLFILNLLRKSTITLSLSGFSGESYFNLAILISSFGLLVYSFFLYSRMHPYGFLDAWSIWNYTARFIFRTNSPVILFESRFYEVFHPDYPPGLGLNVAWGWLVLDNESTRIPISIAFYTLVSPALILWGAVKTWKGSLNATLAAIVYLMSANLIWSVGQLADTIISLYILSAVIMFYYYVRSSNNKILLVAGILIGFSAWMKNEGILFIFVMLTIYTIMAVRRVINWKSMLWLGFGLSLPLILLVTYKLTIDVQSDLFSGNNSYTAQILDIQRWRTIGREFFVHFFRYANWPISATLVLFIYIFSVGQDRSDLRLHIWLFLIAAGQLAGYFSIYLVTPHDLDWHIFTSMERLISHIFPTFIFWVFISTHRLHSATIKQLDGILPN